LLEAANMSSKGLRTTPDGMGLPPL